MYLTRKRQKNSQIMREKSNAGSALVTVIIVMMLVTLLASVVLYTTYMNYKIKLIEENTANSFYSGEMALEEIKHNIETQVSRCYASAYMSVLQNYNDYSESDRQAYFRNKFITEVKAKVWDATSNQLSTNVVPAALLTQVDVFYDTGATDGFHTYEKAIQINGVRCRYVDDNQYVAIVGTDFQIDIPSVAFDDSTYLPEILSYCLIGDEGMFIRSGANNEITGNVYAGSKGLNIGAYLVSGVVVAENANVKFSSTKLISKGALAVTSKGNTQTDSKTNLWTSDIEIAGGKATFEGSDFVRDDLTVSEKNSEIVLKGSYFGYGTGGSAGSDAASKNSSSILINGTNTKLDMSGINTLALAGQAYIGMNKYMTKSAAGGYFSDENDNELTSVSNMDVLLGQSLAVKQDQTAYLVPNDMMPIGYGNPMLLSAYKEYESKNGVPTGNYWANVYASVAQEYRTKLGIDVSVKKYIYRSSSQTSWVYMYLDFNSASDANAFFYNYYINNKASFNQYIKDYLSSYNVPLNFAELNLAGNMIYTTDNGATYSIKTANLSSETVAGSVAMAEYSEYEANFIALCTNLSTNGSASSTMPSGNVIFESVLDTSKIAQAAGGAGSQKFYGALLAKDADCIIVDGAFTVDYNMTKAAQLIIASGDVVVAKDFNGLIISNGTISVQNGIKVTAKHNEVGEILLNYSDVLEVFKDTEELQKRLQAQLLADPNAKDTVEATTLVNFVNWTKE